MALQTERIDQYRQRLLQQREGLLQQQQKVASDLNAVTGALQVLETLSRESAAADLPADVAEEAATIPTVRKRRTVKR